MPQHDQMTCAQPRAAQIANLNDQLRTGQGQGKIVVTKAVHALTGFDTDVLMAALAGYDGFDADNDPHGERDFGDLTVFGTDLLWKVDYFDAAMEFGSEDPANPDVTTRVLTVMTAADW